jgi:hypothetical protein
MDTTSEPKHTKTADQKAYIREWKRKDYLENGDKIKLKNKAYYYKYKCGLTADDMAKYDTLLPYVAKIKMAIDEFRQRDLEKSINFLENILGEIKAEQQTL